MKKIYLAVPYSGMQGSAYSQANEAAALILKLNFNVFSPITHCHTLVEFTNVDIRQGWDFWKERDFQFIDWCDELWVLIPEEGPTPILLSEGVQQEIRYALENSKNVKYFSVYNNELIFN